MPLTVVDSAIGATQNSLNPTSVNLTGLTVAPGDLLLVFNGSERGTLANVQPPTCPDGAFSEIGAGGSGSSGLFLRAFHRQITTQNTTNMTVTVTNSTGTTGQKSCYGHALVLRNHDGPGDHGFTANADAPSVTPATDSDVLVIVTMYEDPQTSGASVAGMTSFGIATDQSSLGQQRGWYEQLDSAADTGVRVTLGSNASRVNVSLIVKDTPDPSSAFLAFF